MDNSPWSSNLQFRNSLLIKLIFYGFVMDQTPTHQHRILVISISNILSGAGTIAPTSTSLICQDICAWQVHSNQFVQIFCFC